MKDYTIEQMEKAYRELVSKDPHRWQYTDNVKFRHLVDELFRRLETGEQTVIDTYDEASFRDTDSKALNALIRKHGAVVLLEHIAGWYEEGFHLNVTSHLGDCLDRLKADHPFDKARRGW